VCVHVCVHACVPMCVYLRLLEDVDGVHVVLDGVDHDEHVPELGGDDAAPVVPGVLRPHDVHLVITQVPQLEGGRERAKY